MSFIKQKTCICNTLAELHQTIQQNCICSQKDVLFDPVPEKAHGLQQRWTPQDYLPDPLTFKIFIPA